MKNPNNASPNNSESNGNWLGDNVSEFSGDKDEKTEIERVRDFFRERCFSKEYNELMTSFIQKLNPRKIILFQAKKPEGL